MARRKAAVKSVAGGLTGGKVVVAEALQRSGKAKLASGKEYDDEYSYVMRKLWVTEDGDVLAHAGCGQVFVCTVAEVGDVIAFLQQIAANASNDGVDLSLNGG